MKAESLRVSTEALKRLGCTFPPPTEIKKPGRKSDTHPEFAGLTRKEYIKQLMRKRRAAEKLK